MTTSNKVSANPALVEFPRDVWGFTTDLRQAGLRAASAIRGNDEKHKLFLDTLRVIAQHAVARLPGDAEALTKQLEEIAARDASSIQRQFGRALPEAAPAAPAAPAE